MASKPCRFPGCPKFVGRHGSHGLCTGHVCQMKKGLELTLLNDRSLRPLLPNPAMPGTLLVPLLKNRFAIIDETDGPAVGRFVWSYRKDKKCRAVYAQNTQRDRDGKFVTVKLHRFLWNLWGMPLASELDHNNTDGLDCRRQNLRPATRSQNAANTKVRSDSQSGHKGVQWRPDMRKWTAMISDGGKKRYLGSFVNLDDARDAYAEAARRIYGEFARAS